MSDDTAKGATTTDVEDGAYVKLEEENNSAGNDQKVSVIYAVIAGMIFAVSNSITAELSQKYGGTAVFVFSIAGFIAWSLYRICNYLFKMEPEAGF